MKYLENLENNDSKNIQVPIPKELIEEYHNFGQQQTKSNEYHDIGQQQTKPTEENYNILQQQTNQNEYHVLGQQETN